MKRYEKYTKWIIAFVFGVALIAVYKTFDNFPKVIDFLGKVMGSLKPFITGAVIAYILSLPSRRLEGVYKKIKHPKISQRARGLSIISVYVILLLIIFFVVRAVIPRLYENIIDLYNNIIPFTQKIFKSIKGLQENTGITFIEINEETAKDAIQQILNNFNVTEFSKYAKGAINFTSGVLSVFISLIISVYMLFDRENIFAYIKKLLNLFFSPKKVEKVKKFARRTNRIFSNYIYSCVLDALVVAVLATIILSIIGVKYAIIFGAFIGVCNLIPYFGSIVSNIIVVIITFFLSGWAKAIWSAVGLLILGQVDGNIIGPKIMGNKLEAKPLLIIFAVTLGGGLFGVGGMILSVPIVMVIRMVFAQILENIEEKKQIKQDEQE